MLKRCWKIRQFVSTAAESLKSRSERERDRERDTHMRQSRSTPALSVCLQDFSSPPGSVGIFRSRCDTHTPRERRLLRRMMRMMKTHRITGVAPLIVLLLLLHATRAGTCLQLALELYSNAGDHSLWVS